MLMFWLIYCFNTLDHVFHPNIIVYCQQNRYVRLATYTDYSLTFWKNIFEIVSLEITKTQNKLDTKLENDEHEEIKTALRIKDEIN